jgi:hypothetical protein
MKVIDVLVIFVLYLNPNFPKFSAEVLALVNRCHLLLSGDPGTQNW